MPVDYDAVIVGAGLSGLSLASRLAESSWADRPVLVVDDGRHDVRGRAWAYWTREPHGLSSAAAATWDTIAVHASESSAVLPLRPYLYVAISGERLHDLLNTRLAASSNVEFVTGSADSVRDDGDHALVTLNGAAVTARWAFDSRPVTPAPAGPRLDFLGWEIDTDADAFDPMVATFMDFRGRQPGTVSFCYLLPTTARHALVEIASFQWTRERPDLARALADYLRQVCELTTWTVTRTEAGSLPLVRPPTGAQGGRVIPIGVRGGMLKPSTGFAVERIQRHSAAIVESLHRYGHPHAIDARHRRHAWLDRVFLEVLRRDPDIVEDVMARLFTRNGAPAVLRFLDEDSNPVQEARLVATLPVSPFLRAAIRPRGTS
jgi:lycopene beta-cyclase